MKGKDMYKYSEYNREERNLCSHLFRLLLSEYPQYGPLKEFVGDSEIINPRIFSEVALLRDAYFIRKPNVNNLLDQLCEIIATQENLADYRLYSDLPTILNNINKTHPKQIRAKAKQNQILLTEDESILYSCFQGMFNAKPDLVVCYNNNLLIYEAKYTLNFDQKQIDRTRKIGEVWKQLLYEDLDFDTMPDVKLFKLGLEKYNPHISWQDVLKIGNKYLKEGDLSLEAFNNAVKFS